FKDPHIGGSRGGFDREVFTGRLARWPQGPGGPRQCGDGRAVGVAKIEPGLRQCPHWVKSRHRIASTPRPLYPQKRTSRNTVGMSALCQKRTSARYSIISSARPISVLGTVRPNAFPVFRLIASSYLVGACTARSASFSPLPFPSTPPPPPPTPPPNPP